MLRDKAEKLGVSHGTVRNRLLGLHSKKRGRQTKFTEDEERNFVDLLLRCADFGVPMSKRLHVKVVFSVGKDKGKLSICFLSIVFK